MTKTKLFKLKVRDTQQTIFEGEVDRISSFNDVGPFDVYPMHANFISIIRKSLSIYKEGQKIKEIDLEEAVLKVKQDAAKVFLGLDVIVSGEAFPEKDIASLKKPVSGAKQ